MPKQRDILREYTTLRQQLTQERQRIQARLQQIEAVLGEVEAAAPASPPPSPARQTASPRPDNKVSLREAITQATSKQPLKVREIVDSVQKLGYRFQSSNPVNSVGAYLYGREGKKHFKAAGGRFAPISRGGRSALASRKNGAPQAAPAKRTMSAEARKRIATAQKARWAKLKSAKAA